MDKMTTPLIEKVNAKMCDKLAFIDFKEYQRIMKGTINSKEKAKKYIAQWTMMRKYCGKMRDNNYAFKVDYKIAGGRIVAKGQSLQRINKLVRGALCHTKFTDFDMVNCHPVLLVYICNTNDIPCWHLEKYMRKREDHLQSLRDDLGCSRDEAKHLYLSCANYDKLRTEFIPEGGKKRKIKCKTFLAFDEAMKDIQKVLVPMYRETIENKWIPKDINPIGSMMSYIMCDMESKVLSEALEAVKVVPNVKMFDGFMLDIDTEFPDGDQGLVASLDVATKKFGIKWSVKEHDIAIVESLTRLECSAGDNISLISPNLLKMCNDLLTTLFKDRLCRNQGLLYFKTKSGWRVGDKSLERELFRELSDCDLWVGEDEDVKCVSSSNACLKNLIEFIINRAIDDPQFSKKMYDWTKGKIYFQNGYYDFLENRFIKTTDMNTFIVIPRDFSEKRDLVLRGELYRRVFDPIFTVTKKKDIQRELRDRFLHKWSRIIAGHVEDKDWMVLCGHRNCGKGVIIDLTINTFGKYIGMTNSENFAVKKNDGDSQKALGFLFAFEWKRMMVASEMEMSKKGAGLSGTLIKKINSGGDTLCARKMYQDETEFRIQSNLVLVCNDMDEVKPVDTMEKCEMYSLNSKFVEKGESTAFHNISYYDADPTVKSEFIQDPAVLNEFVHLLIDAYNKSCAFPDEARDDANEYTDDLPGLIQRHFIVGGEAMGEAMTLGEFRLASQSIQGYSNKKLQDTCIGLGALKPKSPFLHGGGANGAAWISKQRGLKNIRRRHRDDGVG